MSFILTPALTAQEWNARALLRWPRPQKPTPPAPMHPIEHVEVHRQPEWAAPEWQLAIRDLWRQHRHMSPAFTEALQQLGLLHRCCYFSAYAPNQTLAFRYISEPTVRYFGAEWAEEQLGKAHTGDPNEGFAQVIDRVYEDAIAEGQPVYNRLVLNGPPTPTVYSHLLLSWSLPTGERALLACIDHQAT